MAIYDVSNCIICYLFKINNRYQSAVVIPLSPVFDLWINQWFYWKGMLLMLPSDWQNPSETICLECASCHNPEKMNFINIMKFDSTGVQLTSCTTSLPSNIGLQCMKTVNLLYFTPCALLRICFAPFTWFQSSRIIMWLIFGLRTCNTHQTNISYETKRLFTSFLHWGKTNHVLPSINIIL